MQNNEGATIAKDDVCQWELAAASVNGVLVRQPDTGNLLAVVGIADAAIAASDFGLVQVYGYRSTSRVFQTNTSIATGQGLVAVAGAAHMATVASSTTSSADATLQPVFAVVGESIASSTASATISIKVFIRAL